MKNKKITMKVISSIGAISAVAMPVAITVSCGSSGHKKTNTKTEITNPVATKPTATKPTTKPSDKLKVPTNIKKQVGNGEIHQETSKSFIDNSGVVTSGSARVIDEKFGYGNFADPKKTFNMDTKNMIEYKTRKTLGQPYTIHYHLDDVLNWTAGKDTDDAYSVATIPLKDKELAGKFLASQKDKQLNILGSLAQQTSQNKTGTVGKNDDTSHIFQMWSQITSFVGWGGSASEGNLLLPSGNDINAAHRNGVPLLGTVFFPPIGVGGSSSLYDKLSVKAPDGTFPMADKIVEMASHFGFDGWFLNFESSNTSTGDMKGFMEYFHKKMVAKKLFTVIYDVGDGKRYLYDKSDQPFDQVAIDYGNWNVKQYKTEEKDKSYGYDYDSNSDDGDNSNFADKNIWMYTYFKRHGISDGDDIDLETFSDRGGSRDPRTKAKTSWTGLSQYFQAHTTINKRNPFSTSFETGIGSKFYINGEEQKLTKQLEDTGYRNQGIQDILPTYRYINDEYNSSTKFSDATRISTPGVAIKDDGATWKVQIDETGTPYYGSSNLHYTGKISAGNTLVNRLYGSDVTLKTGDKFSVVVQGGEAKTGLALWLQDNKYDSTIVQEHVSEVLKQTSEEKINSDLKRITYTIPSILDGKVMSSFGLSFTNGGTSTVDVDSHIGQLNFTPVDAPKIENNKITELHSDGDFVFNSTTNARINWKMENNATVDHYVIWSTGTSDRFEKNEVLSVTSIPAAFLKGVDQRSDLNLVIDAVGDDDNIISSNKVTVKTTFKKMDDPTKWSQAFVRDGAYTVSTGHDYTFSFKDTKGNVYFGDNNATINEITFDGLLKIKGDDSWGIPLEKGSDLNIVSIFEYDALHIAAISQKGTIYVLDKKTGEKTKTISTGLTDYMKSKSIAKLDSVSFASVDGDSIAVFAKVAGKNVDVVIDKDGKGVEIPNQSGNNEVTPTYMNIEKDGSINMGYLQNGNVGIANFASTSKIDLTTIKSTTDIKDGFDAYIKSSDYENAVGSGFIKNQTAKNYETMVTGDIKLIQKLSTGNTLVINAYGLAMIIDPTGKEVSVTSIIDGGTLKAFAHEIHRIRLTYATAGFAGSDKDDLDQIESFTDSLIVGKLWFDEKRSTLQGLFKNGLEYERPGVAETFCELDTMNLHMFIKGSGTVKIPTITKKDLSKDADKTIGGLEFGEKVGDVWVFGGHLIAASDAKLAVYDSDIDPLKLGKETYLYDGNAVRTATKIYDSDQAPVQAKGPLKTPAEYQADLDAEQTRVNALVQDETKVRTVLEALFEMDNNGDTILTEELANQLGFDIEENAEFDYNFGIKAIADISGDDQDGTNGYSDDNTLEKHTIDITVTLKTDDQMASTIAPKDIPLHLTSIHDDAYSLDSFIFDSGNPLEFASMAEGITDYLIKDRAMADQYGIPQTWDQTICEFISSLPSSLPVITKKMNFDLYNYYITTRPIGGTHEFFIVLKLKADEKITSFGGNDQEPDFDWEGWNQKP